MDDLTVDIIELHAQALDSVAVLAQGVNPDQMGLQTPCEGWDVRFLLMHIVVGNHRYADLGRGRPAWRREAGSAAPRPEDVLGEDHTQAYRESSEALKDAWRDPERLELFYELPFGQLPGRAAIGIHLLELVAHGWDLARATGQEPPFHPQVVQAARGVARMALSGERQAGVPFAPAVTPPDGATEIDRLAAFLGRQP